MPVAYSASGRLTLLITPLTRVRKIRLPVNLVTPITTPVQLVILNPVGGNVVASTAAQNLWAKMQFAYASTVSAPTYLIEQNFNGIFSPLETGALTGAGTNIGADVTTVVSTFSFRDSVGHKLKFLMPETALFNLGHAAFSGLSASLQGIVSNFLATVNAADVGNWARSRGGNQIKTFSFLTASPNKRYRRQAGLT